MLRQDVGTLLRRGGGRLTQDLALLLCPSQACLSTLYRQILLELGDGQEHGQNHLSGGRREIPLAQVKSNRFIV
jgi:hypothetical protein